MFFCNKIFRKIFYFFILVVLSISTGCSNSNSKLIPSEKNISYEVLFCPKDNCSSRFIELTENANSVRCAFYDINLEKIIKNIDDLIIESNNQYDNNQSNNKKNDIKDSRIKKINIIKDLNPALMHNKFCIIDDILWTGSFNPTFNGNYRNNNDVIIVNSRKLAQNYLDEFNEMKQGIFGDGYFVKNPKIIINGNQWENYFCPEDLCKNNILKILYSAKKNIYFMTFSFTDPDISNALINLSSLIYIEGLMEKKRVNMKYNQYSKMKDYFTIHLDKNPYTMHHKVFIIDEKIVITGSYNPTIAADKKNDENILVIRDEDIAKKFLNEFYLLISEKKP